MHDSPSPLDSSRDDLLCYHVCHMLRRPTDCRTTKLKYTKKHLDKQVKAAKQMKADKRKRTQFMEDDPYAYKPRPTTSRSRGSSCVPELHCPWLAASLQACRCHRGS